MRTLAFTVEKISEATLRLAVTVALGRTFSRLTATQVQAIRRRYAEDPSGHLEYLCDFLCRRTARRLRAWPLLLVAATLPFACSPSLAVRATAACFSILGAVAALAAGTHGASIRRRVAARYGRSGPTRRLSRRVERTCRRFEASVEALRDRHPETFARYLGADETSSGTPARIEPERRGGLREILPPAWPLCQFT